MLLGCSLAGAAFLLLVDTLARSLLPDQEIPIGIITSAFGSLFFMLFMFRRHTASA
jgi:iron complex transport system permease protein